MTEKKKPSEDQIWTMVMTITPVVILMNVGSLITNDSGMQILYSGVFGGIGGIIGFLANHLTKDKGRITKIIATLGVIGIGVFTLYIMTPDVTDKELLERDWYTQEIGLIEFETPKKLKLKSSEIPKSVKGFYNSLELYTDEGEDRITSFMKAELMIDTISVLEAYSGALEGMLQKLNVDSDNIEVEVYLEDEEEVSCMFSFDLNGQKANGYGYMYKLRNKLESIWLMPIKRGYSVEYIEEFEAGIFPDYE